MNLIPVKRALARVACHDMVGRALAFACRDRIRTRGCIIDTAHPSIRATTKAVLFWGMYESAEIRFVRRFLRRDIDVVELGSSIGVMGAQIAKLLGPGRRLVCVEADARLLDVIASNIRLNAPRARFSIVHGAVWYGPAADGCVLLGLGERTTDGRVLPDRERGDRGDAMRVPARRLLEILGEARISEYALVCDIEGAEAAIIANESAALERCQQIVIELHATERDGVAISVQDMIDWLTQEHGFRKRAQYGPVCVFDRDPA